MSEHNMSEAINLSELSVGIIGTGWVGSAYARNLQSRGISTICYSLDPQYIGNKDLIKNCDVVLLAVPTPTTPEGADYSILENTLGLVGNNKIAVIKSTILPGTTDRLQKLFPNLIIIHSPEFLSVATADHDTEFPKRNIIGIPYDTLPFQNAAGLLLQLFPPAPYTSICSATEAEIIKYSHNIGGYLRIVFHNLLYDVCLNHQANWETVKGAIASDPNNILAYLNPVHKNGRGAGGPCFIKDFSAFIKFYETLSDEAGSNMLRAVEKKNIALLKQSGKDLNFLADVYDMGLPE